MSILPSTSPTAAQAQATAQAQAQAQAAANLQAASAGTTGASGAGSSAGSVLNPTQGSVNSQFNTFLTLLTTELQNQDPTSPLDTNQFTSQLVQFSQLEQTLNTNTNLQTLISGQKTSAVSSALGYIGQTVQANGGNFALDGTDPSTLSYTLPSAAASANLNILNSNGQSVGQIPGTTTSGENEVSFSGTIPGQAAPLPAGQYTFQVVAVDASGNAIPATTSTSGVVTGVDNSNGTVNLHIGTLIIPASSVTEVTS
jgi:flagellar basal-body rod modification protein FlgD